MPEGGQGREGPLARARALAGAARAALEAARTRLDDLNVYPVPDGDTGTNMLLTVRAVVDALERSSAETVPELAGEVTRASLMGARGNSGVILSQILRGAGETLARGSELDARALALALRSASEAAYASVREPQEGTMLTIARELAERAEALAERGGAPRDLAGELVAHAEAALARTPDQLPLLREAGVVDAGGAGLVEIARGIAAELLGDPLPEPVAAEAPGLPLEAVHRELSRYRYCTSFYVEGDGADPARLERELDELGDSVLVVGAQGAVKAHVHTDEPGRALALATAVGVVDEVDVKNMHAQTAERTARLGREPGVCDAVAVCAGAGNARLFRSLGAAGIVEGGRSMNPATRDLVTALDAVPAPAVLLLPNDANVVLAAEQAAVASEKRVLVVSTRTLQAGLGAMVAFDGTRTVEENAAEMERAAQAVRAGCVTRASRPARLGALAVAEGDFLGLVGEEAVASGPVLEPVALDVLEHLLEGGADVLTVLVGADAPPTEALRARLHASHPELEIEVHEGGQPHYPLLFAVE